MADEFQLYFEDERPSKPKQPARPKAEPKETPPAREQTKNQNHMFEKLKYQ